MGNVVTLHKPEPLLWLNDARGVYIPRDFANGFTDRDEIAAKHVSGVSDEDWSILEAGPDHEQYWETWEGVLDGAKVTDENGVVFTLHQDGDLWLVPVGMEWSEEDDGFRWPEEEEQ